MTRTRCIETLRIRTVHLFKEKKQNRCNQIRFTNGHVCSNRIIYTSCIYFLSFNNRKTNDLCYYIPSFLQTVGIITSSVIYFVLGVCRFGYLFKSTFVKISYRKTIRIIPFNRMLREHPLLP